MKAIINYFHVQCGTCGSPLSGEKAWLEAPDIIVECINPDCKETGKQWLLPIDKRELAPFEMPKEGSAAENMDALDKVIAEVNRN